MDLSLTDLTPAEVPRALARLHRILVPGDEVTVRLDAEREARVIAGAGFDPIAGGGGEWRLRRLRTLPDWVAPAMSILVVGLNPSPHAADAGVGFAGPSNRFWPALADSGLSAAHRDPNRLLDDAHIGMTDLVKRTTSRASELATAEYRSGAARVEALVRWLEPAVVLFIGLAGARAAIDARLGPGVMPDGFGGRPAYLMGSTSGLNAHATRASLADDLRAAAELAAQSRSR